MIEIGGGSVSTAEEPPLQLAPRERAVVVADIHLHLVELAIILSFSALLEAREDRTRRETQVKEKGRQKKNERDNRNLTMLGGMRMRILCISLRNSAALPPASSMAFGIAKKKNQEKERRQKERTDEIHTDVMGKSSADTKEKKEDRRKLL